jgi:hypothetical protein|tara:strand:+ start:47 stop:520 length:474 start_codon:yes stop_codon:yes gene_type:complete
MSDSGFLIDTELKRSSILGAGIGRFFTQPCEKGNIVRIQDMVVDLEVYKSVADLMVANNDLVLNFAHGRCCDSDIDTDHIYINKIPFYTNHSSHNNISFRIRDGKKLTYAIRDIQAGEEMLQNYEEYTTIPWFENYLHSIDKISLREFGIKYNMQYM